jgi:hypothetical protein
MLKIRLRIHKIDGASVEYRVTPRTMVAFEKEYKVSITKAFSADNIHVEHLYWLAWDAERIAVGNVKPFMTWLEQIEAVEPVIEDNPTAEGAPAI